MNRTLIAAALSFACVGAFAQATAASTTQRDVNQQTRIENGLKDGSLTTREAGQLEREQSRVDVKFRAIMSLVAVGRSLGRAS